MLPAPEPACVSADPSSRNPRFLNTAEAGAYLKLSPRWLEKLRVIGGGPRFRKLGRRVVYTVNDLEDWADARSCTSTSDREYNWAARR